MEEGLPPSGTASGLSFRRLGRCCASIALVDISIKRVQLFRTRLSVDALCNALVESCSTVSTLHLGVKYRISYLGDHGLKIRLDRLRVLDQDKLF